MSTSSLSAGQNASNPEWFVAFELSPVFVVYNDVKIGHAFGTIFEERGEDGLKFIFDVQSRLDKANLGVLQFRVTGWSPGNEVPAGRLES